MVENLGLKEKIEDLASVSEPVYPLKYGERLFRSSAFATLCPREEVLAALGNVIRKNKNDSSAMFNLALGTGVHQAFQSEMLPRLGLLLGSWKCENSCEFHQKDGKFSYTHAWQTRTVVDTINVNLGPGPEEPNLIVELSLKPEKCVLCGGSVFQYTEQFFKNKAFGITAHPDGFIKNPWVQNPTDDDIGVLELKTIGKTGSKEVKNAPKFEHIIQVQIYMWLTGLKWAVILYWDKSIYGTDGLIEHKIERDEDSIEAIKKTIAEVWMGIETGVLPARICSTETCSRASDCSLAKQCFKLDDQYEPN
jgi:hypothetical protein